jgi:hypothetical protein
VKAYSWKKNNTNNEETKAENWFPRDEIFDSDPYEIN